ncbi:MAG TPA: hypothetical protein DEF51_06820 [Myxococcales bacterium]|nr:hypothetical protein [Myxococcales bacterium]
MTTHREHTRTSSSCHRGTQLGCALVLTLFAGCDARSGVVEANMSDGGALDALVVSGADLGLQVLQARRAGDEAVLELAIVLGNGPAGAPAPLNPLLFQVQTTEGLLIAGGARARADWVDGVQCDAAASVVGGASTECFVVFDLPDGATPTLLIYQVPGTTPGSETRTASASVAVEPCTTCADSCTYLDRDPDNCGSCGQHANRTQTCENGRVECTDEALTLCAGRCVNLQTDDDHCGACDAQVGPNECVDGARRCMGSEVDCGDRCADLQTSGYHCGACGRSCEPYTERALPAGATRPRYPSDSCRDARCNIEITISFISCSEACRHIGLVCRPGFYTECDYDGYRDQPCLCGEP